MISYDIIFKLLLCIDDEVWPLPREVREKEKLTMRLTEEGVILKFPIRRRKLDA